MFATQRRKLDLIARTTALVGSALFFISSILLFIIFSLERRSFV